MRPIKFRVWNNTTKEMRYRPSHTPKWWFEQDIFTLAAMGIDYTFEQFTGLTDKNGKEIYEGDIVKRRWRILEDKSEEDYETSVVGFTAIASRAFFTGTDAFDGDLEVVGNIHEKKGV